MEDSESTITGAVNNFLSIWKECSEERNQRIQQLLPCICLWLEIRTHTIEKLESLVKKADQCQKESSDGLVGKTMRLLPDSFRNNVPDMSCLKNIAVSTLSVLSGAEAAERTALRQISGAIEISLRYDKKETAALNESIQECLKQNPVRQNAAIKIIVAAVQNGVFDSVADAHSLNTIKSASIILTGVDQVPAPIFDACFNILEQLETRDDLDIETKQAISQNLRESKKFRLLVGISAMKFAQMGFDFCTSPNLPIYGNTGEGVLYGTLSNLQKISSKCFKIFKYDTNASISESQQREHNSEKIEPKGQQEEHNSGDLMSDDQWEEYDSWELIQDGQQPEHNPTKVIPNGQQGKYNPREITSNVIDRSITELKSVKEIFEEIAEETNS